MTNEEKAKDITKCLWFPQKCTEEDIQNMLMQMAQWKDEQMKETLNNILIECDACFDEQTTNTLESIIKHQISLL